MNENLREATIGLLIDSQSRQWRGPFIDNLFEP